MMLHDSRSTISRVVIGDARTRTFQIGHAFASVVTVRVLEANDREVSVDIAHTSPSQVAVIFDVPPPAGKLFMVYIIGQ